jgi:drug/metabolite transporter (DMT)-like permease
MASPRRDTLGMVAATALWGATFVITRDALPGLAVMALMLARFGTAAIMFGALTVVLRRPISRATLIGGIACAPFIAACYALQAYGLRETSAGSSAFLTCAGTLAAPFFAWMLWRERPSGAVFAGMALALTGSALLSWRSGGGMGRAEALTLVGAVAYAFQIAIVARVAPQVDPIALTGVQSLATALCFLPFANPSASLFALAGGSGPAWRVLYLALGATVLAPLLQVSAQRTLSAGRVALLFALEPLFALGFAVSFGGEHFATRWWFGAALILCAVLVAELNAPAATGPFAESRAPR